MYKMLPNTSASTHYKLCGINVFFLFSGILAEKWMRLMLGFQLLNPLTPLIEFQGVSKAESTGKVMDCDDCMYQSCYITALTNY